ncbi:hypothetical protein KXD93_10770 [Mucilaginibacter sp. BJC16-A38]|uniref:hypothetical protein n=1 Tax=Mucilaginibacter phenanthrenivorans TaxID=1234842 RepID=UPI002157AEEC|nr:hypothetical protein [Mucilaginibacter phenanthrenivorans]MCR8558130.1 hypothetical protein [Mucilaginibacter phenanthrenivorans]
MSNQHNMHQWAETEPGAAKFFIHNYFMNGNEFPGWKLVTKTPGDFAGRAIDGYYMWVNPEDDQQAFKVEVVEAPSYDEAKKIFQEFLQNYMRPLDEFARPTEFGNDAYVYPEDEMQHGIFLFANLVISVDSVADTTIACNSFIRELYKTFHQRPLEHSLKPNADNNYKGVLQSTAGDEISVGQSTALQVTANEWYYFVLTGPGELSFKGGRMEYASDEPGTAHVDLYTVGEASVIKDVLKITVK